MERRDYCSYNLTRECFLALEVADFDTRHWNLNEVIPELSLNSGEGLWMVPFRGMPTVGNGIPLDLIYLDEAGIVLDVEESFVPSRGARSRQPAASVLALPHHTIYSSQTQPGDQMMICMTGEMVRRLEVLSNADGHTISEEEVAVLREMPHRSGGTKVQELKGKSRASHFQSPQSHEIGHIEPRKGEFKLPKNWFDKWWSPDPRKTPREPVRNLVAYYWTGGAEVAHGVRDINLDGLYVVTEDRWYPGTMVLITLQRTDCKEEDGACRSVRVYATAVRWGVDGVGLQFVVSGAGDGFGSLKSNVDSANRKEVHRFLRGIRKQR